MFVFMAGAMSTGAFVARYSDVRKSSAMPLANFPRMFAVAGATMQQIDARRNGDVLDIGVRAGLELAREHAVPGDRFERELADELAAPTGS